MIMQCSLSGCPRSLWQFEDVTEIWRVSLPLRQFSTGTLILAFGKLIKLY